MTESPVSSVVTDPTHVDPMPEVSASTGVGDRTRDREAAEQPLVCPRCQGVTVGVQATAYTPERGRLIVTNGYCQAGCSG
ncbi:MULTISPECIES: hypothetical protein [unclassified Nonomuraea]|uniref:hypothetical protein n=1 Tax=unclassified Nonomuraea TaxID=2593643 RepID=UPI0035C1F8CD